MSSKFDPKIKTIMKALRSRGCTVKGISQGIRLKLDYNIDVDIYTLRFDANKLRARLKLYVEDAAERSRIIGDVNEKLRGGLGGTSDVEDFKFSRCISGDYYYYARLFMGDEELSGNPDETPDGASAGDSVVEPENKSAGREADLQKVVEVFESVDSKMFRKAMDGLGVPRTSILRVSLARIFRAATDLEELKTALKEESMRISDPRDRSDLEKILASNEEAFLDPAIRILHRAVFDEPGIMAVAITDY